MRIKSPLDRQCPDRHGWAMDLNGLIAPFATLPSPCICTLDKRKAQLRMYLLDQSISLTISNLACVKLWVFAKRSAFTPAIALLLPTKRLGYDRGDEII